MLIFKNYKQLFFVSLLVGLFFAIPACLARENVTDWYIKDFKSEILVNKNSTLDITEKITADCGIGYNKHGVFRVLPEKINIEGGQTIKTPVELLSITDFNGQALKFSESRDPFNKTVTWKIGDPDKSVQGVNYYEIHYLVKNTIRFGNANFDELYWNLNGNFWDLEIDNFQAKIIFPAEVNQTKATVDYYTGSLGSKSKDLATYFWSAPNILEFTAKKTLGVKQGVTASIIFPKNIFIPFEFSFWETYGDYFYLLLPIIVFFVCFFIWHKYGKDPRIDKTVIAEYEVPGKLTPLETGLLMTNGSLKNSFITAEIINLAVKGLITIKETNEKVIFFNSKDYELTKKANPYLEAGLNPVEKIILDKIFADGETIKLSDLKNDFYKVLPKIKKEIVKSLVDKGLIAEKGLSFKAPFIVFGIIFMVTAAPLILFSLALLPGLFISGLIMLIFGILMPKRTPEGAELNWRIKGFKLFMETVDKHRAAFYEKENIFEKFLPYAILFGITGLWIKKMKEIYGEDFYATHAPIWYVGSLAAFDADSLSAAMASMSTAIAANTSSPSGSGGAGGAGGGGGGGGGGGW